MNKTVLYSICKNEEKSIEEWIKYHNYFDAICLLDTGSTDKTFEIASKFPIKMYSISYEKMDFGEAKNKAFELAKNIFPREECLYINLDIDEYLDELTFERMRKHWTSNYDGIEVIRTTKQEEKEDIKDRIIRIHSGNKNWKWNHVLHENLEFKGDANILNSEYTFLHRPDMSKNRNYGKLAENWIRYFLKAKINYEEVDRLLNTCLRSIYFKEDKNVDKEYILNIAEERLLSE